MVRIITRKNLQGSSPKKLKMMNRKNRTFLSLNAEDLTNLECLKFAVYFSRICYKNYANVDKYIINVARANFWSFFTIKVILGHMKLPSKNMII